MAIYLVVFPWKIYLNTNPGVQLTITELTTTPLDDNETIMTLFSDVYHQLPILLIYINFNPSMDI